MQASELKTLLEVIKHHHKKSISDHFANVYFTPEYAVYFTAEVHIYQPHSLPISEPVAYDAATFFKTVQDAETVEYENGRLVVDDMFALQPKSVSTDIEQLEPYKGEYVVLDTSALKRALELVVPYASKDQFMHSLHSVYFDAQKEELNVVASDGFRLGKYSLKLQHNFIESVLLPVASAKALLGIATLADSLKIGLTNTMMYVETPDGAVVGFRLLNYDYPDYQRVIENNKPNCVIQLNDGIVQTLRRIKKAATGTEYVRLEFVNGTPVLKGGQPDDGLFFTTREIGEILEGEPPEYVLFNLNYALEALAKLRKQGPWYLSVSEPTKALFITAEGEPDFMYMFMPVRDVI